MCEQHRRCLLRCGVIGEPLLGAVLLAECHEPETIRSVARDGEAFHAGYPRGVIQT